MKKTFVLHTMFWCFGGKCLLEAASAGTEIGLGDPSSLWEELLGLGAEGLLNLARPRVLGSCPQRLSCTQLQRGEKLFVVF